uniref:hypothetical protein n=1 Tax=Paracidovorax oryzae TaxID=862720 RepID=UPI001427D9E5
NSVETFQPYDPSQAMGSMDPVLPVPAGKDGGCGAVGQLIVVIVSVVVAVYTGGIAGAMLGNLAGQMVGNAVGVQDGINWKSVALSGISAGIAGELEGLKAFSGTDWQSVALRMGTANLITQGVGVATGLQSHFDWRGVAASAAGAAAGAAVGSALKDVTWLSGLGETGAALARGTLSSMAAGVTAAVARGGRVSIQQVAVDAFGNALGESLAAAMQPKLVAQGLRLGGGLGLAYGGQRAESTGSFPNYSSQPMVVEDGVTSIDPQQLRIAANSSQTSASFADDHAQRIGFINPMGLPTRSSKISSEIYDDGAALAKEEAKQEFEGAFGLGGFKLAQFVPAVPGGLGLGFAGSGSGSSSATRPPEIGGTPGFDVRTDMPTGVPGYVGSYGIGVKSLVGGITSLLPIVGIGVQWMLSTGVSSGNIPEIPDVLVGDQSDPRSGPNASGKKHTSGPLAPEYGGVGDFVKDLDVLTGGVRPWQRGDSAPPGSLVGENGIFGRPGNSSGGQSIDIPAKGNKPHETLHY